jgi:hypothetical protein
MTPLRLFPPSAVRPSSEWAVAQAQKRRDLLDRAGMGAAASVRDRKDRRCIIRDYYRRGEVVSQGPHKKETAASPKGLAATLRLKWTVSSPGAV